jgi:hypothetical protein
MNQAIQDFILGLEPVTGKCILIYAEPVRSWHGFHRLFCRLTGQL